MNSQVSADRCSSPASEFACPHCATALQSGQGGLTCPRCAATYPIRDRVIDFRVHYLHQRHGGDAAKRNAVVPDSRPFLQVPSQDDERPAPAGADQRSPLQLFLRLPADPRIVAIGHAAAGAAKSFTYPAMRIYTLVSKLEPLMPIHQFPTDPAGADETTLVLDGTESYLPFANRSIDCAVLFGLPAGWTANESTSSDKPVMLQLLLSNFGQGSPRKSQLRLLTEVCRVLKPEGQVILVAENRCDYNYLRNQRDAGSGMWFTSLLPRFLANAYSVLVNRRPYRAYTYCMKGYQKLLRRAEYMTAEIYGLAPDNRRPAALIPFQVEGDLWQAVPSRGRDRIRLNRHFVPGYAILASPGAVQKASIAERIAEEIESRIGAKRASTAFFGYQITSKNKGIIAACVDGTRIVVKLSLDAFAERGNRCNHRFLECVPDTTRLRRLIPRALAEGTVDGVHYCAETMVDGRALVDEFGAGNHPRHLAGVARALRMLNPDLERQPLQPFLGDIAKRQMLEPLARLASVLGQTDLVDRVRLLLQHHFNGMSVRCGLVHGDFCADNLFVQGFEVSGIIDWEDSCEEGIPALDALNYIESFRRSERRRMRPVEVVGRLASWDSIAQVDRQFLDEQYRRCGLNPDCHLALVYLYWIRHVADQLDGGLANDRAAFDARVTEVLEQFANQNNG